uniref:Neurotransmitter-gated ion-channel ligand-binding domain-containing protein n=1 Tax=Iconisemion striatum TaxID=60296 RepID=A0A1A7YNM9_9TELE
MTNAWLQLYWTDVYLSWNPENYPGVQNLRFPSDQIWTPDILLYNSADERFDATFHTNVLVNASGYCQYIPPGILKSTCYIDVRWFPFDVQKCDLKFGSWTHNGWLLDLQMLDVDTSTYISNGEWDLVGVPAKRNELYYECCKEPYPDVTFTVTMRRRTLYYGLNLLIPSQRFRDQDEAEAICSEWKFAAAVVDRLCLVAFSLFSIICTFTILMSAPNFIEAVSKDFT